MIPVSEALERFRATAPSTGEAAGVPVPLEAEGRTGNGGAGNSGPAANDLGRVENPSVVHDASPATPPAAPEAELTLPEPGVYLYATEGEEQVDVLGGTTHTYPAQTTITVTATGCGVASRWDALAERWDERRTCLDERGEVMHSLASYHEFFGQPDRRDYECEGVVVHPPRAALGQTWEARCSDATSTIRISSTFIDIQTLTVGGTQVEALHGRGTSTVSGSVRGTQSEEMWLDARTGLALRRVSTVDTEADSPLGAAHYHEEYEITLTSLTPRS